MASAWPGGKAEHELALANCTDLVSLTGIEVDQARRCQRPLGSACADEKLAAHDEYERVLMHLMFLRGLALGQQERDNAVCIIVGTKDLRAVSRDSQPI
jgi:hypothetical protein